MCSVRLSIVLYTMDETALELLKVIEDKDTAIKALTNKLEGYYTTCTRFVVRKNKL